MSSEAVDKRIRRKRLDAQVYKILEGIVGPERISEDRAVVETYSKLCLDPFGYLKKHEKDGSSIPACIILPESIEEVQSIVRVLNRYRIPYVPFTNGQALSSPTTTDPTVCIHFSRMDKILDLDEANKTMTVQPYVDYAMVNTEAMKVGLWNGGIPTGCSVIKIVSQFAFCGVWHTQAEYCGMTRAVVGVKVVLPTGEILKAGSLSIPKAEAFCEYGPGPNLMGFIRCNMGTMGIIVEITIKLHKWVGPDVLETPRERPSMVSWTDEKYQRVEAPQGYRVLWLEHPDMKSLVETVYKISEAGIGIGLTNIRSQDLAGFCSTTQEMSVERIEKNFIPKYMIQFILGGLTSEKQLEYEEKVVREILSETGGKMISKDHRPDVLEALSHYNLDAFRTYYCYRCMRDKMMGGGVLPRSNVAYLPKNDEIWEECMVACGPKSRECSFGDSNAYLEDKGHFFLCERDTCADPVDKESILMGIKLFLYGVSKHIKGKEGGNAVMGLPREPLTSSFPEVGPDVNLLLRKVRKVFDPNGISAPGRQVFTEDEFNVLLPDDFVDNLNQVRGMVGLDAVKRDRAKLVRVKGNR